MSRRENELAKLASMEERIRQALLEALPDARDGRDSLFFLAPGLHDFDELQGRERARTIELTALAREIVSTRQRLGEPPACLAAEFLTHCTEANDRDGHHRLGAKRRADLFLKQIQGQ